MAAPVAVFKHHLAARGPALHPAVAVLAVQLDAVIRAHDAHVAQIGQAEVGQSVRNRPKSDEEAQSRVRRSLRGATALRRRIAAKRHSGR